MARLMFDDRDCRSERRGGSVWPIRDRWCRDRRETPNPSIRGWLAEKCLAILVYRDLTKLRTAEEEKKPTQFVEQRVMATAAAHSHHFLRSIL